MEEGGGMDRASDFTSSSRLPSGHSTLNTPPPPSPPLLTYPLSYCSYTSTYSIGSLETIFSAAVTGGFQMTAVVKIAVGMGRLAKKYITVQ